MNNRTLIIGLVILLACKGQVDKSNSADRLTDCFESERYGLESIIADLDSVHVRIWYSHAFLDRVPVVSIKQSTTGKWTAELFLIIWNFDSIPARVGETRRKELKPHTDWANLNRKLEELQIYSLPDIHEIPGLDDGLLDGSSYTIEIEKGDVCRHYRYHLLEQFQDEFWQAKNMVTILDEIQTELGIPWKMNGEEGVTAFWKMANDSALTRVNR